MLMHIIELNSWLKPGKFKHEGQDSLCPGENNLQL